VNKTLVLEKEKGTKRDIYRRIEVIRNPKKRRKALSNKRGESNQ